MIAQREQLISEKRIFEIREVTPKLEKILREMAGVKKFYTELIERATDYTKKYELTKKLNSELEVYVKRVQPIKEKAATHQPFIDSLKSALNPYIEVIGTKYREIAYYPKSQFYPEVWFAKRKRIRGLIVSENPYQEDDPEIRTYLKMAFAVLKRHIITFKPQLALLFDEMLVLRFDRERGAPEMFRVYLRRFRRFTTFPETTVVMVKPEKLKRSQDWEIRSFGSVILALKTMWTIWRNKNPAERAGVVIPPYVPWYDKVWVGYFIPWLDVNLPEWRVFIFVPFALEYRIVTRTRDPISHKMLLRDRQEMAYQPASIWLKAFPSPELENLVPYGSKEVESPPS